MMMMMMNNMGGCLNADRAECRIHAWAGIKQN